MEQINNDQTIRECSEVLGHQVENIPSLDTSKIILTAEVNPKELRRSNIVGYNLASGTSAATVYTCPTDRDFFLTSIHLAINKDATSDYATGTYRLNGVINGAAVVLLSIPTITLTAQQSTVTLSFSSPIKLDRGSAISLNSAPSTVGVFQRSANITGYTTETK